MIYKINKHLLLPLAGGVVLFGLSACDTRDKNGYQGTTTTPGNGAQGANTSAGAQGASGSRSASGLNGSGTAPDGAAAGTNGGGGANASGGSGGAGSAQRP